MGSAHCPEKCPAAHQESGDPSVFVGREERRQKRVELRGQVTTLEAVRSGQHGAVWEGGAGWGVGVTVQGYMGRQTRGPHSPLFGGLDQRTLAAVALRWQGHPMPAVSCLPVMPGG